MARVFSIDFEYEAETYTAVVTFTKDDADSPISVYVPDAGLHHILPGGKITFNSPQELHTDTSDTTPVHELLNSIQTAIKAHEESKPSVGLW